MSASSPPGIGSGLNGQTYHGGDGKQVLLGILEESQNIIADDDAGLAGKNVLDTHFRSVAQSVSKYSFSVNPS
jgi:hypothetical protein